MSRPGPGAERFLIALLVAVLLVVPIAVQGWPTTLRDNLYVAQLVASGLCLLAWRSHPRLASMIGLLLFLGAAATASFETYFPMLGSAVVAALAALFGYAFTGRHGALAAVVGVGYVVALRLAVPVEIVPLLLMTVPPYAAGVLLRLREETATELAQRSRELEEERELFAALARQHERARIASELHDIVGHAISVMVVQAAAGQRLVTADPQRTDEVFDAIAESARRGQDDLQRLVELLDGSTMGTEQGHGDLTLIDEVVARAARTGLDVTCRFDGDRDGVPAPAAHVACRVVQESLTNALKHAPGAAVQVRVSGVDRTLTVCVENGPRSGPAGVVPAGAADRAGGRGLIGLRERIQDLSGHLRTGPTEGGGWLVEAHLPAQGCAQASPGEA